MVMAMNMNNNGGRAFSPEEKAVSSHGKDCISDADYESLTKCRKSLDCFTRNSKGKYPLRDKFMNILIEELEHYITNEDDLIIDCSEEVDIDLDCKKMMP